MGYKTTSTSRLLSDQNHYIVSINDLRLDIPMTYPYDDECGWMLLDFSLPLSFSLIH